MNFGNRLRKLRNEKNLTQAELAKILAIGESTISFYESNKRQPDYDTLTRFADFFDVSVDYLLCRSSIRKIDGTLAAHRTDDPTTELPEEARRSLEEFQDYIFKKYGVKKE